MKKIITVLAALAVTTAAAFAGPAISVGGGFGGVIQQEQQQGLPLQASPVFSVKGDFQWEKFGVAAVLDVNINYLNDPWHWNGDINGGYGALWDADTRIAESLLITPYASFNLGEFNFNAGPTVGVRFEQNNANYKNASEDVKMTGTTNAFVFGATTTCNYKITEKLNAYLEIPVLAYNFFFTTKQTWTANGTIQTTEYDKAFMHNIDIYVAPKFGVTFTF